MLIKHNRRNDSAIFNSKERKVRFSKCKFLDNCPVCLKQKRLF